MSFKWKLGLYTFPIIGMAILFFLSGFAALCYQLVWQRLLYANFGMNTESVTIIVSLFMFGLGMGALLGGKLQKYPHLLLYFFVASEIIIGVYGLCSVSLLKWLGGLSQIQSLTSLAIAVYSLLALPTLLMGATLPMLVGYIHPFIGHTGRATGLLYATNTLGSAIAAFLTVQFLYRWIGLQGVIWVAVILNFFTALAAYILCHQLPKSVALPQDEANTLTLTSRIHEPLLWTTGFMIGFVVLSQEILWYRLLGFISGSSPYVFGWLLAVFLAGIGFSSLMMSLKATRHLTMVRSIVMPLICMTVWFYFGVPLLADIAVEYNKKIALYVGLLIAGMGAWMSGGIFPSLCHFLRQCQKQSAGNIVSRLYFLNVVGATLGPIMTGFVFFEYFSFQTIIVILSVVTALLALVWCIETDTLKRYGTVLALFIFLAAYLYPGHYQLFFEKLQFAHSLIKPYTDFISNRSGIISVVDHKTVYGGGAYDGKISIDPVNDINIIQRAYLVATIHPQPKRILEIGVSSGSWARVLSLYKPLVHLHAVEINKGYLELIRRYPEQAVILDHPKVQIEIDDGRRWLKMHPDEKFDMIVMNARRHFRSNASNILSKEMMELCKSHLLPGGYLYVNSTGAAEVAYTAAHVFSYVATMRKGTMVIAGDTPSQLSVAKKRKNLRQFIDVDGYPVFAHGQLLEKLAHMVYPNEREALLQSSSVVITDDNMATEFKRPRL